jgi:aryl-alcohol dehydrogenase-like predicted oxidoreductase
MRLNIHGLGPVNALGVGTWQWGDRFFWGYGKGYQEKDLQQAFQASLAGGVELFDTAEVYGLGRAEQILGGYMQGMTNRPLIVTKFFPFPWRLGRKALLGALRGSLGRLQLSRTDLYLQHWPFPPVALEVWAEALAQAYELGLTRSVGVSNFSVVQLERTLKVLQRHNVPLSANQVEYSLLDRSPETSGLKAFMEAEGIALMAYSPLAMGWLTGKYTLEAPPKGAYRSQKYARYRSQIPAVLAALQQVAGAHGATPAQVALRWAMQKGTLPIPGAKNAGQATSNAAALQLLLTAQEMELLDRSGQLNR